MQTDGRRCHGTPASRVGGDTAHQQGPFAPRALPRFVATADPSVTLSPSAHFPGSLVIGQPRLRRFRGGTRRASPVARRALATVPSLPPRRRDPAASARLPRVLLPSCALQTLGLREINVLSRLPLRSLSLRPGNSLTILLMASSMGSRGSVSLPPAIQATGRLALTPAGLPPAEHGCLYWTHAKPHVRLSISNPERLADCLPAPRPAPRPRPGRRLVRELSFGTRIGRCLPAT